MREKGGARAAAAIAELAARISLWRRERADHLGVAPESVVEAHDVLEIALAQEDDEAALREMGVSKEGVGGLSEVVRAWKAEQPRAQGGQGGEASGDLAAGRMPVGPKALKPLKPMAKIYHQRFQSGERLQAIAGAPPHSGKAVQPRTVCNHILDALAGGHAVCLERLEAEAVACGIAPPPDADEWSALDEACAATGQDPVADRAEPVQPKSIIRHVLGSQADREGAQKSGADRSLKQRWRDLLQWYLAFRRSGTQPSFGEATSVKRAEQPGAVKPALACSQEPPAIGLKESASGLKDMRRQGDARGARGAHAATATPREGPERGSSAELAARMSAWRLESAAHRGVAPHAVLDTGRLLEIARKQVDDEGALLELGVCEESVAGLAELVRAWKAEQL